MPAAKKHTPAKKTASRRPAAKKRSSAAARQRRIRRRNTLLLVSGIALLLVIFLVAYCVKRSHAPARIPDGYNSFCIDLSHHNGVITDWDALEIHVDDKGRFVAGSADAAATYPVTMVYVKATEGETMVDPRFLSNWTQARARRYAVGAYHFYLSDKDPVRQAQNYIHTVGPLRERDLAPVLDVEKMHRGCTEAALNAGIRTWLETVEVYYGKKPVIYCPDNFARRVLDADILSRYRIWVAHYGVSAPDYADWTLWQFTDAGLVSGIQGPVDISVER